MTLPANYKNIIYILPVTVGFNCGDKTKTLNCIEFPGLNMKKKINIWDEKTGLK